MKNGFVFAWFLFLFSGVTAFLSFISVPVSAAPIEEGESRKLLERETGILSAQLLSADQGRRWSEAPFPEAENILADLMKADPAASGLAAARENAGIRLKQLLAKDYAAMQRQVLAPFQEKLPGDLRGQLEKVPDGLLEKKFSRIFPSAFQNARKRLVEAQRAELVEKVYPSEEELEKLPDPELTNLLSARLQARRKTPLFEENVSYVRDSVISPLIASGRAQQKRQLDLAETIQDNSGLWAPPEIIQDLEKRLSSETQQWKEDKIYKLFPKTRSAIANRAARLPRERVMTALPERITLPDYAAMLEKEPEKHLSAEPELSGLCEKSALEGLENTLRQLKVPEPMAKKLQEDPAVRTATRTTAEKRVRPELLRIREKAVAAQMKKYCQELAEDRWKASPETIEEFHASGGKILPGVPEFAFEKEALFEETRRSVSDHLRRALIRGAEELAGQMKLVALEYNTVTEEMRSQQQKNRPGWLEKWFGTASGELTLETIRACYEARIRKLHNAQERLYPDLFDSIRHEIEIRSRAILQQLQAETALAQGSLPGKSEDSSDTSSPESLKQQNPMKEQETKEQETEEMEMEETEKTLHCLILMEADRDGTLSIRLNGKTFHASGGEEQEERTFGEVIAELTDFQRKASSEEGPILLEVEVQVGGGPVYYRSVARLREALKADSAFSEAAVRDGLAPQQ